ncbi:hypothetical protein KUV51_06500 [Tateyamaria omphalii]|uniref:rhodanese-like domain-containing protein n=1 Tax=Tateyamaria omphalii TaxID=299262 RepID=UPI001C997BE5|nr:rhodanese-like domain-containing protein [Tateyamaria omphalii]MBY5932643.1 hypothetical protein [Tateyamaria omphalii]
MDHTPNAISLTELLPLLGTHRMPQLLDVRLPEDIAQNPHRLPTARHVPHNQVVAFADRLDRARRVVTICHKGQKLSHGAAAHLRSAGYDAHVLSGGSEAWRDEDYPTLASAMGPAPGVSWVLSATRDRRAALGAWIIRRWFDAGATLLWVPADHVQDVADRFDAQALHDKATLTSTCATLGLTEPDLLAHIDAIETGQTPGTTWIDTLPHLHETDEDLVEAALPILDAAWLAHRQLTGQNRI